MKGLGYLRNTTIATFVMFFGIGPLLIYILAFKKNMGVKGIWESTSISITLGDILFIYWVFSFDLIKLKELADERIKNDNDIKEEFLTNINNNDNEVREISLSNNNYKKENQIKNKGNNIEKIEMNEL